MAKKGALKSTFIVTTDDLKVNGGRWRLQSGAAIRVRGFNSSSIGDRKITGGDALPIHVLAETDARVNGGNFLLKGGQPIQVTDVIGSARGVIQGNAIPVWPVDDAGNYDASFLVTESAYVTKVKALGPIAYWVLGEAAGAVAVDEINSPAQDGTYTGVTLGQPGIGDGNTAPLFDGVNDFVDIYSAAFDGVFDGTLTTIACWMKVSGAGVWTDTIIRSFFNIGVNTTTNYNRIRRRAGNNEFEMIREGSNVQSRRTKAGFSPLDYFHVAITIDEVADEAILYVDGLQEGAIVNGLGAYAGALGVTFTVIGAENQIPASPWSGFIAHLPVWDRILTPAEIATLAVV